MWKHAWSMLLVYTFGQGGNVRRLREIAIGVGLCVYVILVRFKCPSLVNLLALYAIFFWQLCLSYTFLYTHCVFFFKIPQVYVEIFNSTNTENQYSYRMYCIALVELACFRGLRGIYNTWDWNMFAARVSVLRALTHVMWYCLVSNTVCSFAHFMPTDIESCYYIPLCIRQNVADLRSLFTAKRERSTREFGINERYADFSIYKFFLY